MALLTVNEKFGQLEVISLLSDDPEERYRLLCHRCKYDGVLCNVGALLTGRARLCYDCNALARATPHQRVLAAFKKQLDLSPAQEVLDYAAL
jgi:hypothetical protein